MSLPLYKAEKILKAGGFNAALMAEARAVVGAAEAAEVTDDVETDGVDVVDEDLELPEVP